MSENIEDREQKERARFETFLSLYDIFISGLTEEDKNSITLNKELAFCAVRSYFDDIYRFKDYSGSSYADNHKQAGYSIKWIARFKPIQIKENVEVNHTLLTINSTFALFVGFAFLDVNISSLISLHFFQHLLYITTYRNISGRFLASLFYVTECAVKKQMP